MYKRQGINRPDVLQRIGRYVVPKGAPDIPGLEIAGEIVGGDVSGSDFKIGDMVCALVQGGGYACLLYTSISSYDNVAAGRFICMIYGCCFNVFKGAGPFACQNLAQ